MFPAHRFVAWLPRRPLVVAPTMLLIALAASIGYAEEKNLTDDSISNAIESEMLLAKGVSANDIDIEVNEGIVTLSGEVDNILAKERAKRISRMTKGVRSVIDQIRVEAGNRSDSAVRTDILSALAVDPATDSWEIGVSVQNGKATLTGSVDSYAERELAATVTRGVKGVREVVNNMTVDYTSDRRDDEIKADIQQRLQWDVRIDDALIDVQIRDGKVTLSGTVGSAYERSLAAGDAWVSGVTAVDDDELKVEWWARDDMQRKSAWANMTDEEIRDAIVDAFLYDPRVMSFNPTVTVDNGAVTLTGTVDNLKAKRAAAQVAEDTVGVWRVKNYLKVRPVKDRDDEDIKKDVEQALLRDPYVERYEVTVNVYSGEVYLYGDVDSYFEKSQAEDLAAKVNGVTNVHNYLDVSYEVPSYSYHWYSDWDPTLYDYDYDYDYQTVESKSDRVITEDINSELFWSPFVDADEVTVSVDDGVVTLTGTVDSWGERSAASENAIEGGAVKVINKLEVDYN